MGNRGLRNIPLPLRFSSNIKEWRGNSSICTNSFGRSIPSVFSAWERHSWLPLTKKAICPISCDHFCRTREQLYISTIPLPPPPPHCSPHGALTDGETDKRRTCSFTYAGMKISDMCSGEGGTTEHAEAFICHWRIQGSSDIPWMERQERLRLNGSRISIVLPCRIEQSRDIFGVEWSGGRGKWHRPPSPALARRI